MMSCDDTAINGRRRFEVFTVVGKRLEWPPEVKASDRIKVICWDGTALTLMAKRLEQGAIRWPMI